jgi:hypothetical protein
MWFTPEPTASRNTANAASRSSGRAENARAGKLHGAIAKALYGVPAHRKRAGLVKIGHGRSPSGTIMHIGIAGPYDYLAKCAQAVRIYER